MGISCFRASLFSNVLMHDALLHPLQWLIPRVQAWGNTPLGIPEGAAGLGFIRDHELAASFYEV